jgi:hypothetical protein
MQPPLIVLSTLLVCNVVRPVVQVQGSQCAIETAELRLHSLFEARRVSFFIRSLQVGRLSILIMQLYPGYGVFASKAPNAIQHVIQRYMCDQSNVSGADPNNKQQTLCLGCGRSDLIDKTLICNKDGRLCSLMQSRCAAKRRRAWPVHSQRPIASVRLNVHEQHGHPKWRGCVRPGGASAHRVQ